MRQHEAQAACQEKNGYLVEIFSQAEQDAIVNWLNNLTLSTVNPNDRAWIGLKLTNNEWVWGNSSTSLSVTGYSNWGYGSPSGDGICAENIFPHWNDLSCYKMRLSICEI
jgi:hypothetical protein